VADFCGSVLRKEGFILLGGVIMGVFVFIIVLLFAADDAWGGNATIGVGQSILNSKATYAEAGYVTDRNWEFNLGLIGVGETKDGPQTLVTTYGVSKLVKPNWCFMSACNYYRIGVAGVHGSPLVGPINFRLGVGVRIKNVFEIEAFHYSSAGIFEDNTGIDGVMIKMVIPW
jgi:hypothetical protein